jgi:hypothetical protein
MRQSSSVKESQWEAESGPWALKPKRGEGILAGPRLSMVKKSSKESRWVALLILYLLAAVSGPQNLGRILL